MSDNNIINNREAAGNIFEKKRKCKEIQDKINEGVYKKIRKTSAKTKSDVWQCFSAISDDKDKTLDYVFCEVCSKILVYTARTTSNLLQHPCVKKIKKQSVKVEHQDKKKFAFSCTAWSISNLVSFTAVTSKGFENIARDLVKFGAKYGSSIDIPHLIPCGTTVNKYVNTLFDHFFPVIKAEIKKINAGAITTEMWSDSYRRLSYISVTVHYIIEETLIDRTISVMHMDYESQTAANIVSKLEETFSSYELEMEKFVFVTDRGRNFIAALFSFDRISCAAHILNNILSNSTNQSKDFTDFVNKCKELVNYLRKSTNLQWKWKITLKSSCEIRRNSNVNMFETIQNNYNEACQVLGTKNQMDRIQDIRLDTLTEVIQLLQHFETATNDLQSTSKPTLYLCYPYYYKLTSVCALTGNESPMVKQLKQNLGKNLKDTWLPELKIHHLAATFLYPKCKKLPMFTDAKKKEAHDFIICIARRLAENREPTESPTVPTSTADSVFDIFMTEENAETGDESIQGK